VALRSFGKARRLKGGAREKNQGKVRDYSEHGVGRATLIWKKSGEFKEVLENRKRKAKSRNKKGGTDEGDNAGLLSQKKRSGLKEEHWGGNWEGEAEGGVTSNKRKGPWEAWKAAGLIWKIGEKGGGRLGGTL